MSRLATAKFATEAELCAAFVAALPKDWTAYPETEGWDLLLVRKDGVQIGVEAKLRLNVEVLVQALDGASSHWRGGDGPDYRAVLVPERDGQQIGVEKLCRHVGVQVIEVKHPSHHTSWSLRFSPYLPGDPFGWEIWHEWWPQKRCTVPDYVPDVVAGASAPVSLTTWKVRAIKLAILMEKRGFVTASDFKVLHVSPSRWTQPPGAWLVKGEHRGEWVRGDRCPDFRAQHPRNYAEIEADFDKWAPKHMQEAAE